MASLETVLLTTAHGPTGPTGPLGAGVFTGDVGPRGIATFDPRLIPIANVVVPVGSGTGTITFPDAPLLSTGTYILYSNLFRVSGTNANPMLEYSVDGGNSFGITGTGTAPLFQSGWTTYSWNASAFGNQNSNTNTRLGLVLDVNNQRALARTVVTILPNQVTTFYSSGRSILGSLTWFNTIGGSTTTLITNTPSTLVNALRVTYAGVVEGRLWLFRYT